MTARAGDVIVLPAGTGHAWRRNDVDITIIRTGGRWGGSRFLISLLKPRIDSKRTHVGMTARRRQGLFLPRFACGVFGVARGLLVVLERCIGVGLGEAFGIRARPLLDGRLCLVGFRSRA